MTASQHTSLINFIWNIADDVLRDVYVRSKYRDVILPMIVLRRLDAVLEPTKADVLAQKQMLDEFGITEQDAALNQAAGQAFHNASPFRLRDLLARPKKAQLEADFRAYLAGFSENVREILDKFKFINQIPTLMDADALGFLIEKFLSPTINFAPTPVLSPDGSTKLPALDNHAMGTVFEELIRRFNEENNEEAGEHFTPRDVVSVMADLIFRPVAERITTGTYLVYDDACGTGGMLTVAEERLHELAAAQGKEVEIHLYGQEVQPETYAITKADLLLKGEGAEAVNIKYGSTLSHDGHPRMAFDFMLANPPYGKSWSKDLEHMGGKKDFRDARFVFPYGGEAVFSLLTRSSDGQLLFLANKLAKMKTKTALGSRIAQVHNGSALFTGDAGQGESNIRRWILENDWLEAIIALPLNIFYNTGIATYIWVLSNRKEARRRGQVQLIDASGWQQPLRKNLGKKNCELSPPHQARILEAFLTMEESAQSKIFPNEAFGYQKIVVERPLRLRVELTAERLAAFANTCTLNKEYELPAVVAAVAGEWGAEPCRDFNDFVAAAQAEAKKQKRRWTAKREKLLQANLTERDETAAPVVKSRLHADDYLGGRDHNPFPDAPAETSWRLGGWFANPAEPLETLTYEPDPELRDTEQVPLLEPGGVAGFVAREVWPHAPDAWVDADKTQIGYEISFTRYFYQPQRLRTLEEIAADIFALEAETDGLLHEILPTAAAPAAR
ncbi:N-6 DNA methylase [uncultured Hymenobacter sp.]|uniref:type I restriction-modification system subunit M n=1 Tax=uncultured Hymenobacter sp. TaxID=170016 RepID=UPI0035C95468